MIETWTVLDMTPAKERARIDIGSWNSGKVHSFDNEKAARSRRTRIANLNPSRSIRILKTEITPTGNVHNWWLPE